MDEREKEKIVDRGFRWGMAIKLTEGIIEIIFGFALLVFSHGELSRFARRIFYNELMREPNDLFANFIIKMTEIVSVDKRVLFAVIAIALGLMKLVLIIGVLREKKKVYLIYIGVLAGFIAYQSYRFAFTGSWILMFFNFIDILVIAFVYLEYREKVKHLKKR